MKSYVVAPSVLTPDERAEYERRAAQRFAVGDRVREWSGEAGVVVAASHEVPDRYLVPSFLWPSLMWVNRLRGRPAPQKQWHYQVKLDRQSQPGSWYCPSLLEPEEGAS